MENDIVGDTKSSDNVSLGEVLSAIDSMSNNRTKNKDKRNIDYFSGLDYKSCLVALGCSLQNISTKIRDSPNYAPEFFGDGLITERPEQEVFLILIVARSILDVVNKFVRSNLNFDVAADENSDGCRKNEIVFV